MKHGRMFFPSDTGFQHAIMFTYGHYVVSAGLKNFEMTSLTNINKINVHSHVSVVFGFLPLQNLICGWVFLIFFILTVCCIVFLYFKLPEVRGGDAIAVIATNIQRL